MKVWTVAAVGLLAIGSVGVAVAQAPANPPPPPMAQNAPPPMTQNAPPPMGGPEGMRGGWGMRHHRPGMMFSKAAHFRLRKGDAVIDVKCADDEPMKACVDAAGALMDKAAAAR